MFHLRAFVVRVRALLALGALTLSVLVLPALAQAAGHSMPKSAAARATSLPLTVMQARGVAVPPGITRACVFVTVTNPGAQPVVLSAARSPVAAHAMLTLTGQDKQGLTGMQATPTLTVPAPVRRS